MTRISFSTIPAAALLAVICIGSTHAAEDPYRFRQSGKELVADNPGQRISVRFRDGAARFSYRHDEFELVLTGAGPVKATRTTGPRVEFDRFGVTEWFLNRPDGIEQGFTISEPPRTGKLEIALEVRGDYSPALEAGEVVLVSAASRLRYGGLTSWDADGRVLPSRAVVEGRRIRLLVDDARARYPVTVDPVVQEALLTPPNPTPNVKFGTTVAISGNTMIVGAPGGVGVAYVYTRGQSGWTLQASLTPSAPQGGMEFGASVALDGDTAVVGAPDYSTPMVPGAGKVYVFVRSGGQWTEQANLIEPTPQPSNRFGAAVAISGDTILAGAPNDPLGPLTNGFVYILARSGTSWSIQTILQPTQQPFATAQFGAAVAVDGDTAVIGAPGFGSVPGNVSVYIRTGTVWDRQAIVRRSTFTGQDFESRDLKFGGSVAIAGNTALIGAPAPYPVAVSDPSVPSKVYVIVRSGTAWSLEATLAASDTLQPDKFGASLSLNGDAAVIGAPGAPNVTNTANAGAAYLFSRSGASWTQRLRLNPASAPAPGDQLGSAVALAGNTIAVGVPGMSSSTGATYAFAVSNVSITSNPAGRSFTLSGTGCGATGTFTTPYSGFWSTCTLDWGSPQYIGQDTRYTFQNWSDSNVQNPRTFSLIADPVFPVSYAANFATEYELTTQATPVSGGAVTGAGWYTAGTSATVAAIPASGFVFAGFSGALTGASTPQVLPMNGPASVTGSFVNTPPAVLSGIITSKSGPAAGRVWTISLANNGPGIAYNAQLFVMAFAQTFGTACTSLPVRLSPAVLPISLGTLTPGAMTQAQTTLDFSGCPANSRFTVNLGYMSNGGASGGLISLVNQVQ